MKNPDKFYVTAFCTKTGKREVVSCWKKYENREDVLEKCVSRLMYEMFETHGCKLDDINVHGDGVFARFVEQYFNKQLKPYEERELDESIITVDHALVQSGDNGETLNAVSLLVRKSKLDYEIIITEKELEYLLDMARGIKNKIVIKYIDNTCDAIGDYGEHVVAIYNGEVVFHHDHSDGYLDINDSDKAARAIAKKVNSDKFVLEHFNEITPEILSVIEKHLKKVT